MNMNKLKTLKSKWLKDPKVKAAYDKIKPNYDLARKLIAEKLTAKLHIKARLKYKYF